jgi:hypothetical protein
VPRPDFVFALKPADGPLVTPQQKLLNVVGELCVLVDGDTIYAERHFPLLELAWRLWRWFANPVHGFSFDCIKLDTRELLWFKGKVATWQVGSVHQITTSRHRFDISELMQAATLYLDGVVHEVQITHGFDPREVFRHFDDLEWRRITWH